MPELATTAMALSSTAGTPVASKTTVGPSRSVQRQHGLRRVSNAGVHDGIGAELERQLQARGQPIDDQHAGALVGGTQQDGLADGTGAEDDHRVGGGQAAAGDRMEPDGHRFHQRGELGRQPLRRVQQRGPDGQPLSEGTVDVGAVGAHPQAAVASTAATGQALAAHQQRLDGHPVADSCRTGVGGRQRQHAARELVSLDGREVGVGVLPGEEVDIRAADTDRLDGQQRLVAGGTWLRSVLHLDPPWLDGHESSHRLHFPAVEARGPALDKEPRLMVVCHIPSGSDTGTLPRPDRPSQAPSIPGRPRIHTSRPNRSQPTGRP